MTIMDGMHPLLYDQKDESESNCNGAQTILHPK
jgi:hypothetical protein